MIEKKGEASEPIMPLNGAFRVMTTVFSSTASTLSM